MPGCACASPTSCSTLPSSTRHSSSSGSGTRIGDGSNPVSGAVRHRAYVGLGSNLGDREATLRRAVELLDAVEGVEVLAVSTLRETDPVGVLDQPRFLNGAVAVDTTHGPRELLETLLEIERSLGRVRDGGRWGPRIVDLDLLLYGDLVVDEPGLRVPHPHLHERRFVLEPLAELEPGLELPGHGPVTALIAALD